MSAQTRSKGNVVKKSLVSINAMRKMSLPMLQFSTAGVCQMAYNNNWLELWTFHFYRIDLESDRGFLEEGSRKLTFWIYLISRTVFNIFMKTSYNIAVLLQFSAFYFPTTFERQIALYSPCRLVGLREGVQKIWKFLVTFSTRRRTPPSPPL